MDNRTRICPIGHAPTGWRASVRDMEHGRRWWLLLAALGVLVVAACSRAVPGTPSAAPGDGAVGQPAAPPPSAASEPTGPTVPPVPTSVPAQAADGGTPPAPRARPPALVSDVLADECLLDAGQFGVLLGRPVRTEQSVVRRADGTRSTSCYAVTADRPRAPLAAINVYRVRSGTPAEFVAAARGRPLNGAGAAAALLETAAGPTLQVAGATFLVTLVVQGRSPPDGAWRAAARSALARLPS